MNNKSVGKFISALRKQQRMTQKQMAEKLNVSDKAISRWERDECMPDPSLIPIIADLFDVTCDEILRGERSEKNNDNNLSASKGKQLSNKQKKAIGSVVAVILVVIFMAAIYESWNNMWYDFGKNIYYTFNK